MKPDGHPALIARCHCRADVVAAVNLARTAGIPLAVRAGGHSLPGLSTCDGGLVIDLTALRGVSVDTARRVASVEPGATWGETSRRWGIRLMCPGQLCRYLRRKNSDEREGRQP